MEESVCLELGVVRGAFGVFEKCVKSRFLEALR